MIFRKVWPLSCLYVGEGAWVCVGCPNGVLAHCRSGGVRWRLLHPPRTADAMCREDSYAYVRQADVLLFHEGLGRLLYGKLTEARRHGGIHSGRFRRIRGEEGVNGGRCWVEDVGRPYQAPPIWSTRNGLSIEARRHR